MKQACALIAMLMLWPASLLAAAPCLGNFDAFITRFEHNPEFQRQTTLFPIDNAARQPSPAAHTKRFEENWI